MLGEALGAVAALQQEGLAGRDRGQLLLQLARLAGEHQRRKGRELRFGVGERGQRPDRPAPARSALPARNSATISSLSHPMPRQARPQPEMSRKAAQYTKSTLHSTSICPAGRSAPRPPRRLSLAIGGVVPHPVGRRDTSSPAPRPRSGARAIVRSKSSLVQPRLQRQCRAPAPSRRHPCPRIWAPSTTCVAAVDHQLHQHLLVAAGQRVPHRPERGAVDLDVGEAA